jgi:hypothetical protein
MSTRQDVLSASQASPSVVSVHSSLLTLTAPYSESLASTAGYSEETDFHSATTVSVADPYHERTVRLQREGLLWLHLYHLDNLDDPGNPHRGRTRWVIPPGVTSRRTRQTVHPTFTHISRPIPQTIHRIPFTYWPAVVNDRRRSYFHRYRDITVHRPPYRYTAPTTGRTYWYFF